MRVDHGAVYLGAGESSTSSARGVRGALTFGGTRGSEGARVAYKAIEGIVGAETPLDRALTARRPSQTPQDPTWCYMRVCDSARWVRLRNEKIDVRP